LELVWLQAAKVHQRLPFAEIYLTPTEKLEKWEELVGE
jgi:hypothetical protein